MGRQVMMTISMVTSGDQAMARIMVTLVSSVLTTPTHHWLPNGACPHSADEPGHALITIYSSPESPSAEDINISSISHSPKLQPLLRISSHPPTAKQTGKADTEIKIILQTGISWLRGIVSPLDVTHVTSVARILNITSHLLTLRPGFNIKLDSVKHGSLSGRRQ